MGENLNTNVDNEMAVIANLVCFPETRKVILSSVKDIDFQYKIHEQICKTMRVLQTRAVEIDKDIILSVSKNLGLLEIEYEYLTQIENAFDKPSADLTQHIDILKLDKLKADFKEKDVKDVLKLVGRTGYNLGELKDTLYQSYLKVLDFETSSEGKLLLNMAEVVERYREQQRLRDAGIGFYTSGFHHFDKFLTEGLAPRKITVVGARPGCGKSSFVYEEARRLANREVFDFVYTLEMDDADLMDKYIASATGIPIETLVKERASLTESQKKQIEYELDRYAKNPYLHISDKAGLSLDGILADVQKKQLELGIQYAVVTIDLFGQITDFETANALTQQYELKLDKVKRAAKLLGVHFILVNQINRNAERANPNEGKSNEQGSENVEPRFSIYKNRPMKSHLKNSGKWEEVADNIWLLFRGKYYDDDLEDDILEVSIEKQRKGKMGTKVFFEFMPERGRILPTLKLPYDMRASEDDATTPPPPPGNAIEV